MKRSKRYEEAAALIDAKALYSSEDAVALVKKTANTKFDATVEVHICLGIDPKKSDQQIRGTVSLPHGTGKTKKVAAAVTEDKQKDAKAAGADVILDEESIAKIAQTGKFDFEVLVATPDMMPKLAKVAKVLGPRGLMPNPKSGTVGPDIAGMIDALKKGMVGYRNDSGAIVHSVIGKASFTEEQLLENLETMIDAIKKAKPGNSKGIYVKSITLATSMGPGIHLAV